MKCPKCGGEISRFDIKPNCKYCGVNIFYYQQEDLLVHDAKVTELDFAQARYVLQKFILATVGTKLSVFRFIVGVLMVATLIIPVSTLTVTIPMFSVEISIGGWGVYQLYSDGLLLELFSFLGVDFISSYTVITIAQLLLLVILALLTVAMILVFVLAFLSLKKSAKILYSMSFVGSAIALAECALAFVIKYYASGVSFLDTTWYTGFAALVPFVFYLAFGLINMRFIKADIAPNMKEVDVLRLELRKKVKNGEVNIDDLPLPIYETEEERLKRENSIGSDESYFDKMKRSYKKRKKEKEGGESDG